MVKMKRKAVKKRKVIRKATVITKTTGITKTKLVCARCRADWRGPGSPARCPDCGEISYAISVERR